MVYGLIYFAQPMTNYRQLVSAVLGVGQIAEMPHPVAGAVSLRVGSKEEVPIVLKKKRLQQSCSSSDGFQQSLFELQQRMSADRIVFARPCGRRAEFTAQPGEQIGWYRGSRPRPAIMLIPAPKLLAAKF